MLKISLVFITVLFAHISVYSQSIVPDVYSFVSGDFVTDDIHISWTGGELAVQTHTAGSLQITEGFHQPFYFLTGVQIIPEIFQQLDIYPNPTASEITIDIKLNYRDKVQLQLFSSSGKVISSMTLVGIHITERLQLNQLPEGIYYLSFNSSDQLIPTIKKIVKNK